MQNGIAAIGQQIHRVKVDLVLIRNGDVEFPLLRRFVCAAPHLDLPRIGSVFKANAADRLHGAVYPFPPFHQVARHVHARVDRHMEVFAEKLGRLAGDGSLRKRHSLFRKGRYHHAQQEERR